MELKYFGKIDPSNLEGYYDCQVTIGDMELELDLNFEEGSTTEETLLKVSNFLEGIKGKAQDSISIISKDYEQGEESEAAKDFLDHHLDILEAKELISLFGTEKVTKDLFISKLVVKRIGFYPEDEESFAIVDVSLKGDVTNYLLAVNFDNNFEFSYISMDS